MVVNEGLMNGIPIITTGVGNIKYLVGDAALIIPFDGSEKSHKQWIDSLADLYFDEQKLYTLSIKSKKQYQKQQDVLLDLSFL